MRLVTTGDKKLVPYSQGMGCYFTNQLRETRSNPAQNFFSMSLPCSGKSGCFTLTQTESYDTVRLHNYD